MLSRRVNVKADLLLESQYFGHRQFSLPHMFDCLHKESGMCALLGHEANNVDRVHSVADLELV